MSGEQVSNLTGNFVICEDYSGNTSPEQSKFDTMDQRSSGKNSIVALVTSKRANTSLGQSGEVKLEPGENDNLNPSGDLLDPLLARLAEQQQQGSAERQKSYKHKDAVRSRGGHSPADPRPELLNSDKTNMKFEPHTSNPNLGSLTDINITSVGNASEIYGYNPLGSLGEISRQTQSGQNRHLAMPEEATHTRANKRTLDQTTGHSYGGNYHSGKEITEQTISCLQNALASTAPRSAPLSRTEAWPFDDSMDLSSETPEPISGGNYNRQSTIWGTGSKSSISQLQGLPLSSAADYTSLSRSNSINDNDYFGPNRGGWGNRRTFSNQTGPGGPPVAGEQRGYSRRPSFNTGGTSFARTNFDFGVTGPHLASPTTASYTPSPIGTPLSPTATEFTASSGGSTVWNSHGQSNNQQTYVSTIEPLNYRRLLERSVNCNWKYIVDKIVCNNDQQASIFLQQKLKIGTPEQKHAIVDAIVSQAYPLMVNRFGNFLVQRCFEHGTPEQIDGIANAIRGNTLALSMDAFGCHVVQKAFDCVNEGIKATMVSELLRRIPETVVHRYACHVWQKLFELRWVDSPPQIMKYVNEALRSRWHEVALGETGSLVVQNIFENCLEEDKRPCITEVLLHIDLIAHGQFGNWCIQHICEHGAPPDRSRAVDVVIHNAPEYSMDQYASKVVEKCLKIGGNEFLERYLDRVCEGRADRPRIPLIDIASDQYGNYLVQWILQHASPTHREQVASHIRKHMVSLRGSKFGSRVGMLCCNPVYTRISSSTHVSGGAPTTTSNNTSARFNNRFGYR